MAHQQAMVSQYQAFTVRAQSRGQSFAFFFAEDNAAKLVVHRLGVAIEVRHVLVDHIELTRKSTPCFARLAVSVTRGSHVGSRLVHCRVDEKPGSNGRPARVAAHHIAVIVDQHHVGRLHRGKVFPKRIGPKGVRVLY
jgi:hypothetical protein